MSRKKLGRLRAVADLKRDVDLDSLKAITAKIRLLQLDIDKIADQRRHRQNSTDLDVARLTGVDIIWDAAAEANIVKMQMRMAGLAATRDAAMAKARKSFGQAEAVKAVIAKSSRTPGQR